MERDVAAAGEAASQRAPRVQQFRQVLLWPLQLMPVQESAKPPWEILRDMGAASPWREVVDEYTGAAEGFHERHYHEFVAFLPYVQRFLYGEGRARRGTGGDRGSLLVQAAWLAARNVVTLAITEPSSGHPPAVSRSLAKRLRQVRDVQVQDVVAVRRAVDVLRTLPGVDPGRIGYLGLSGGCDLNIVIRTVVMDGETTTIGVGGAIVMQSDAEDEYQEILLKAKAPMQAIDPRVDPQTAFEAEPAPPR